MALQRAVYTALLGRYERLNEQPTALGTDIPFICFTDDPDLVSETWQICIVAPRFPIDLPRSQRDLKIRGHDALAEFGETLYIDNSVSLMKAPDIVLDEWLASADLAISLHSFRDRVIDEFDEVVALNLDDPSRVHEQLLHYARLYPGVLDERPYWNGILARRHTPPVNEAMRVWFDHVLRYSRRDQLSANVAFALAGVAVNGIEQNNHDSSMHRWPVDLKRSAGQGSPVARKSGPLLAEVARLDLQVSRKDAEIARLDLQVSHKDAEIARLDLQVSHKEAEIARLEIELTREAARNVEKAARCEALSQELLESTRRDHQALADASRQIESLRSSHSWRATAPLRWLSRGLIWTKARMTGH